MVKVIKDISLQGSELYGKLGYNLLGGVIPVMKDADGNVPMLKASNGKVNPKAYEEITDDYSEVGHIDIFGFGTNFTYDLGESIKVDELFISADWEPGGDYMLGTYEMYGSDSADNVFAKENLITEVDNTGLWAKGAPRKSEARFFLEGAEFRYFGIKFTRPCAMDDISRVSTIGVYSNKITKQKTFLYNYFDKESTCKYIADDFDANKLNDGTVFVEEKAETLCGKVVVTTEKSVDYVALVGKLSHVDIFTSDSKENLFASPVTTEKQNMPTDIDGVSAFYAKSDYKKYIGFDFKGESSVQQIALYSSIREAKIALNEVRTENYIGLGGNEIPMALMEMSRSKGFLDVFWPVYIHRYGKIKPSVVRVWFQVDWVVDNEEDYKKGKCNFNLPKWKQFEPYLDIYDKWGIELELNFGWKVASTIQSWFSVPEAGGGNRSDLGRASSAPKDMHGFAKTCASVVEKIKKEHKCFKHLTFYNESNYGDSHPHSADFAGYYGHSQEKWVEMVKLIDEELTARNLKSGFDYWLAEESGGDDPIISWMDCMNANLRDINAMHPFHRYFMTHDSRIEVFKTFKEHADGLPLISSEFGVYGVHLWEQSNIEYVMSQMESGINGGLYWTLQGVMMTDPNFMNLNGDTCMLRGPYEDGQLAKDTVPFKEFCLFTNYIPCHSTVLESYITDNDIRVETIRTPDGEYSVFVETKEAKQDKYISLKFSEKLGKKFKKCVYNPKTEVYDGNALVPPAVKEFYVEDELNDCLGKDYALIVYTSLPEVKQIKLNGIDVKIAPDETFKFTAELFGCEGEVEWSIDYQDGPFAEISADGVFTPNKLSSLNDRYCVKATLKGDDKVQAVAIVRIEE